MRQDGGRTLEAEQDARRCPRQQVSWLVTVAAGRRSFQGRTKDVSASGAKILLKERPPLGAEVALRFRPPGRRAVETRAIVWRLDAEGLACMFVGTQGPEFLAAVTARSTGSPARASKPRAAGTVLLAAAEAGVRALAMGALERSGYIVLDAGPQPLLALRMAEEHRSAITLVLAAAELRLMNGESLATRLAPLLPAAKLLLMSSSAPPGPGGPGVLWLTTPCTDAELIARVRQALDA
jgi:CheY-like chemotaxis protein